jgi:hypothetical protein
MTCGETNFLITPVDANFTFMVCLFARLGFCMVQRPQQKDQYILEGSGKRVSFILAKVYQIYFLPSKQIWIFSFYFETYVNFVIRNTKTIFFSHFCVLGFTASFCPPYCEFSLCDFSRPCFLARGQRSSVY